MLSLLTALAVGLYVVPVLTPLAATHPELELDLNFNDRHLMSRPVRFPTASARTSSRSSRAS
jgi:hypothetical protein